jgi:hypothetical protein
MAFASVPKDARFTSEPARVSVSRQYFGDHRQQSGLCLGISLHAKMAEFG